MKKIFHVILILVSCLSSLIAQESLGMSLSNYAGLNGLFINPSSIANSKKYFDIQLLRGSAMLDNNLIYIPQENNRFNAKAKLIRGGFRLEFPRFHGDDWIFMDRFTPDPKSGFSEIRLAGPSIMYSRNGYAFAFQNSTRFILSADNIPYDIAKFAYAHMHYPPIHEIRFLNKERFNISSASWMELGLSYARSFDYSRDVKITAGISIKRLWSNHGLTIRSDKLDYVLLNSDSLNIYSFHGEIGLALPIDYDNYDFVGMNNMIHGRGYAIDMGFTIIRKLANNPYNHRAPRHLYTPYQYRLGLSLLDLGSLQYRRNAKSLLFNNASGQWVGIDSLRMGGINVLINEMIAALEIDENSIRQRNRFSIWLPTAMSLQFDYSFGKDFYLNAFLIQNITLSKNQLSRPSQVSLVPRYENRMFEFAVPLSLSRHSKPRIGLALRVGFITVGTDRLGGFFGLNDFKGFDFYFSIKGGLCKKKFQKEYNRYEKCPSFF